MFYIGYICTLDNSDKCGHLLQAFIKSLPFGSNVLIEQDLRTRDIYISIYVCM